MRGEDGITRGYNLSMDHSVYPQSHLLRSHLGGTVVAYGEDGGVRLERYRAKGEAGEGYYIPDGERVEILPGEKSAIFS